MVFKTLSFVGNLVKALYYKKTMKRGFAPLFFLPSPSPLKERGNEEVR
jgi:hypothetical protein